MSGGSFLDSGGQLCVQLSSVTAGKTHAGHEHSFSIASSCSLLGCSGGQLCPQLCHVTAGKRRRTCRPTQRQSPAQPQLPGLWWSAVRAARQCHCRQDTRSTCRQTQRQSRAQRQPHGLWRSAVRAALQCHCRRGISRQKQHSVGRSAVRWCI